MSTANVFDTEIIRRRNATVYLTTSIPDMLASIEQFSKLDETYKISENNTRVALENIYKENRHFTGKQPIVYTATQIAFYPFFQGTLDTQCNPYFPITKIQDKTFDGLTPLYAAPTKTGTYQRDGDYAPVESVKRIPAFSAIQAFPDISEEIGTTSHCISEVPSGSGTNEALCLSHGGIWIPGTYTVGTTATEKLRAALNPWRADIVIIMSDLYNNSGSTEVAYWQNYLNKIDDILSAIQVDVVCPAHTVDFAPNSIPDLARDYLVANMPSIPTHVTNRVAFLANEADTEEQIFYGVIKLRLHQANGSYAKIQAAKNQLATNNSLIADNNAAISSLNLLKVKSS